MRYGLGSENEIRLGQCATGQAVDLEHQIRGRIGRSSRRAYAYLTYRPGKVLTEVASKRLSAIREYVDFGAGFRIAMRDLEIRGAGNLLGPEQSGYMMSVGYDMYLKLLNDAVLEQQGKTVLAQGDPWLKAEEVLGVRRMVSFAGDPPVKIWTLINSGTVGFLMLECLSHA